MKWLYLPIQFLIVIGLILLILPFALWMLVMDLCGPKMCKDCFEVHKK